MNKQTLIKDTLQTLNKLPLEKVNEVYDFAAYLLSKLDDSIISKGIQELSSASSTFNYLNDEEDLYTVNDLKEKYKWRKVTLYWSPFLFRILPEIKTDPLLF